MIIRKNATKDSVKWEIDFLKEHIQMQKDYIRKIKVLHDKQMKREKKELDGYVTRLAEMQILIKTK